MAVLRTYALSKFAECLGNRIPELKGKISGGPCEAPKARVWPHLNIWPIRFTYYPDQAAEHVELGATRMLMNVGRHEGTVQLRLGAATHLQRMELEQKVLDVFLGQVGRPGIIVIPVPECHDAIVAWELDDDEWVNELAFANKWFSIMTVRVQIPALVVRESVYELSDLRVSLTEDLETDVADIPASEVDTVSIDEDGVLTLSVP